MGNGNQPVRNPDEIHISNKDDIMTDIGKAVGRKASIEYIYVKSYSQIRILFTDHGFSWNAFGHSALKFTTPHNEEVVMNIEAKTNPDKKSIVGFHKPFEYFFGTNSPQ